MQSEANTNLNMPNALLSPRDQQRKFLVKMALEASPCPVCNTMLNQYEASGDRYRMDAHYSDDDYQCPHCNEKLTMLVLYYGGARLWRTQRQAATEKLAIS